MSALLRGAWQALLLLLGLAFFAPVPVHGAFINFDNCLDTGIVNSDPLQLQWIPLFFDAKFNKSAPGYPLNITIYGNVSGQQVEGKYPAPDSSTWQNANDTFGKITNVGSADKYSTLLADFKVLTYTAYDAEAQEFCSALDNGTCPLGPYFDANSSNPYTLPSFSIGHDFGGDYAFSTLAGTIRIISGDSGGPDLACVSANITPDLGPSISGLLTWLPAAILILKGIATLSAAIWSPWGSSDIFRWSSNYGRDEDQLRLVTPGFGDCLQYIQFITLTGALSLQYPGFYQPAVSQASWSLLLFNESYVSHGNGTQSLMDGIYVYNGTYGMTAMSQLIGMSTVEDIWACMAVWLSVITAVVVVLCQLGFLARWIYRRITDTTDEDLRSKNLPFTLGNMIRLMFNYFILPIVALSLFQLVISPHALTSVVVTSVILVVVMIVSAGWILRVIFTTKPRTILFDDMPTVLLYGPLYNTYSDIAAPFALVPVFITFVRGVALGAIQPSGIAQIIVLAICEVILILTLNGFRPFQNQTSMNAYHTFFAIARLITVLLSIAFVPTLAVSEAPKGWIGYAILLIHACVLVFGFFLNAAQTLIEVIARSMGVAGDAQTGAIRGSILNLRMLKKRRDRPNTGHRGSMTSDAAILQDVDARSAYAGGRSRSMSASSQQLLNRIGPPSVHRLSGLENFAGDGNFVSSPSGDTDNPQAGFTYLAGANGAGGKPDLFIKTDPERAETFYRPPRVRRTTNPLEPITPGTKTRKSGASGDFPYVDSPEPAVAHVRQGSYEDGPLPGRDSPAPAYFRDRADSNENMPRTDYAVREVDQYYRGPALSDLPTRKLKTGPADPEGPAANAQSWFQRMAFGVKGKKQKEPSKGFEVVRSSRMPTGPQETDVNDALEMQTSPAMNQERYQDSPPIGQGEARQSGAGAERSISPVEPAEGTRAAKGFSFGFDGTRDMPDGAAMRRSHETGVSDVSTDEPYGVKQSHAYGGAYPEAGASGTKRSMETESDYDREPPESHDGVSTYHNRLSEAPSLGPIESFGGLDLPSRFNSRRSANLNNVETGDTLGGQAWLRQIDGLNWGHDRPAPAAQRQTSGTQSGYRSPPVPRRSSRRTPSQDNTLGRIHSTERDQADNSGLFEGFDSGHTSPDYTRADFLGAPTPAADERPSSYASVSHHRAADSISRNSFGAHAALHGTSAEIFGGTPTADRGLDDFSREG
ncbi:hypothetical protein LTR36_006095 [Oleoguttula mirabilis]|uniref:ML-like domain-containing protein n=1 Tax=Oleoguttula mirabilis TaxID=1507867 RepID=A0AAV9JCW5_9PEZI|nr:hypothetical protein LTR36_006095 [Oleoguttula mirabilis]